MASSSRYYDSIELDTNIEEMNEAGNVAKDNVTTIQIKIEEEPTESTTLLTHTKSKAPAPPPLPLSPPPPLDMENVNDNVDEITKTPQKIDTIALKISDSVIEELKDESPLNENKSNNILPALPLMPSTITQTTSTSRQLFHEAAAAHGGKDTTNFLQQEISNEEQLPRQRLRSATSTLDANVSISRNPSTSGKPEKKLGHRREYEGGEVTYKKIQSKQIMGSIQMGIQQTVGGLASKPKRDLLMNDFWEIETIAFPPDGSSMTPAHHFSEFRFKVYAPIAFRYFRDLFGIAPEDFLISMCFEPLRQLSNPGASGSLFYLSDDDEFIVKTVQKKECEFLQKLLPGYYMNLSQNPRTLLPKFFGLYCLHYSSKNIRLVAMNNLLPTDIKIHQKYDLKGSTFRRKASKAERQKASPTFKDLDFMKDHPNGIFLEAETYNALIKTIQRDCMVLESFQIMDYSLLVGIHNLKLADQEKREERILNARAKLQKTEEIRDINDAPETDQFNQLNSGGSSLTGIVSSTSKQSGAGGTALSRTRSTNRPRFPTHAIESNAADMDEAPPGGIPARSSNNEPLILFIGIIDILQSYRLEKKLEHTFKSLIYNGDTVSVCRPSFYSQRFQKFMSKSVFKMTPTFPLKHSPSKRKTSTATLRGTPQRTPIQNERINAALAAQLRPSMMSGSSTPPPAFDDISEEDLTATATSTATMSPAAATTSRATAGTSTTSLQRLQRNNYMPQRSYISSNRSVISSNTTDDYSDDDDDDDDDDNIVDYNDEVIATNKYAIEKYLENDVSTTTAIAIPQRKSGVMVRTPPSPLPPSSSQYMRSTYLTKTNVQVTTIGCVSVDDIGDKMKNIDRTPMTTTATTTVLAGDLDVDTKDDLKTIIKTEERKTFTTKLEVNNIAS